MTAPHWRLRGLTEADWLSRTDPLRMPKVFQRPPYRKCAFLACAYALNSSGAFRHPFARRVVEALQRALVESPFPVDLSAMLRGTLDRTFPGEFVPGYFRYEVAYERAEELGAERFPFDAFLSAMTGRKPPSRGGVNAVAEMCLGRVRAGANAAAHQKFDALQAELVTKALEPLAFRAAVLALLPETERKRPVGERWPRDRIPVAVRALFVARAGDVAAAAAGEAMADLVREVFGNPFRPPDIDTEWLWWNHGAARHIAVRIAATGDFTDMPVLADALEDAGCTDEDLLGHCRESRAHVPGCWALDAVLDR